MLPRIDSFKAVIFTQRLTTYHESFAPVGKKSKELPYAMVWHEAVSGRWKEDIISTFYMFLKKQRDAKKIVIWLDNCASQNKNWALLSFLVKMVNSNEISATEIHLVYFEPGHTFMSADSFHHQVELSLKRQGKTYDFEDFVEAVSQSNNKHVQVVPMAVSDFYMWQDFTSQPKLQKAVKRVYLKDIVHLKAERNYYSLFYKTHYNEESFGELNFLKNSAMKKNGTGMPNPKPLSTPAGFPTHKKQAILDKLKGVIPDNRKRFWNELPTSQVNDSGI